MADDLDRLVDSIDSEGPSPEFVAALRARIVAETEGIAGAPSPTPDSPPLAPVEDSGAESAIRLQPANDRSASPKRWTAIGLVAAAIALIVSLVVVGRDDPLEPSDDPPVTVTLPPPPVTVAGDATPFADQFVTIDPGTYRIDSLGTPFTLTIDETSRATTAEGLFEVVHIDSQGGDDRTITFMRMTVLSDPGRPVGPPSRASATWPSDDLAGWLDNLSSALSVSNRAETSLGGLPAVRFDLELGVADCVLGSDPCAWFGANRFVEHQVVWPEAEYRIWMVEQGEHDPLAVIVAIGREVDRDWFDRADEVLATLVLGEVGPNPVLAASPGPVELPFLGGIVVDLPGESIAASGVDGVDRARMERWPGETSFVADPFDPSGRSLGSADEVVDALRAAGAAVTEIDPTVVGGLEARAFDLDAGVPGPALLVAVDPDRTWNLPARGRMWIVDTPDRGLLVIAGGAIENLDIVTPLALEQAEALVGSLEFVDPG